MRNLSVNCTGFNPPEQIPDWVDDKFMEEIREKVFELTGSYPNW